MAKPVAKLVQRNTIIIREVPESTTEEEIKNLFQNQEKFLDAIEELKPECGNTYFIKFKDEEITLEAHKYLREQTLGTTKVQARIKSENLTKSYFYTAQQTNNPNLNAAQMFSPNAWQSTAGYKQDMGPKGKGGRYGNRRGRGRGKGFEGSKGRGRNMRQGKRGGGPSGNKNETRVTNNVPLSMAPSHWPPLPTGKDGVEITPGYQGEFKKYPSESLVSIIGGIKEELKPTWNRECVAILDNNFHSNLEILKAVPREAKVEFLVAKRKTSAGRKKSGGRGNPINTKKVNPVPKAKPKQPQRQKKAKNSKLESQNSTQESSRPETTKKENIVNKSEQIETDGPSYADIARSTTSDE